MKDKIKLEDVRDLLLHNLYRDDINLTYRCGYEKGVRNFYENIKEVFDHLKQKIELLEKNNE